MWGYVESQKVDCVRRHGIHTTPIVQYDFSNIISYFDEGMKNGCPTPIILIDFGQSAPNHTYRWLQFNILGFILLFPVLGGFIDFNLSFLRDMLIFNEEAG